MQSEGLIMFIIFTNINTHTVCLKRWDLNIWLEKTRGNHSDEFWKIGLLKLANPRTIRIFKFITLNFSKYFYLRGCFSGILTANSSGKLQKSYFQEHFFQNTCSCFFWNNLFNTRSIYEFIYSFFFRGAHAKNCRNRVNF